MTKFPDMTKLMNPQWARWFDTIKAGSPDGKIRLGQMRRPALHGLQSLTQPADPYSTDQLVEGSTLSRGRSQQTANAALGTDWRRRF